MFALLSFSMAMAEDMLATFTIDKKTYEQMSADQQNGLVSKIQELNDFIENTVRKKIPENLLEQTKNLKIKILLTDKPGRDGLFVPQESGQHTISIQLIQIYSNGIKALLAHEIFHAIHYEINPDEVTWVREGMAQLFEYMTTNELNGMNLSAAIKNPMTPLLGSYDVEEKNPAQYGHNQLYFYYLYSHCGKDQFFWKMTEGKASKKGSFLIDAVLSDLNLQPSECKDFTESAINFEVAKAHNQFQFDQTVDQNKFYLFPSNIIPTFETPANESSLQRIIQQMPVLSSFKIPLKKYLELNGKCKNCAVYFAESDFPYSVRENQPPSTSNIDVILVKLRKN